MIRSILFRRSNAILRRSCTTYAAASRRSVEDPEGFWREQARALDWHTPFQNVLSDPNSPNAKWFSGGQINICYNALDRHVHQGRGEAIALIHDSPVTNSVTKLTYNQMLDDVSRMAGALKSHGVGVGDRVLIYMPMVPQAVMAMLACARIGAIHVVVFGGFAAKELSVRIQHTNPKVVLTASAGIEPKRVIQYQPILEEALQLSNCQPNAVIVYKRPNTNVSDPVVGRDFDWDSEIDRNSPVNAVPVDSNHPLYIIHTSGTTGLPKGIVRPTGGYAVVLPWTFKSVYDVKPGQTWCAMSDLGWIVGHSYNCYGPLLAGVTAVLYEGKPVGTPDAYQFFRVMDEHQVVSCFMAPTALRAIRQAEPHIEVPYSMNKLKYIFSAGEKLDSETQVWAEKAFGTPVLDHWWQTETGWPITAVCTGYKDTEIHQPKESSGYPVPGYNVTIVDDQARKLSANQLGRIAVKLPMPPGFCSTFWNNHEAFLNTYYKQFPGLYDTMDAGYMDIKGHLMVMGRVDDVINVAGHRLSTGALEEAVLTHPLIVDCAVVPVEDSLKGHVPLAICVLASDARETEDYVAKAVIERVRGQIGPVAALNKVIIVPKLPKTRSGKIARSTLADMANNKQFTVPVTIDDISVYPVIQQVMQKHGLALHCPLPL